jgi:uncharacterized phage-associated protein
MASVFDVAKYILEKKGTLTTLKLQKLCYYSQAWHLAWEEHPLFKEDFQAWANGPVCVELFNIHKGKFSIDAKDLPLSANTENLTQTEKEDIDNVLDYYGDKSPHWLSELTHKERPWKQTRFEANAANGDICNKIITKELMLDYYSGL